MKEIGAAKFKEQCLAILDHLDAEGLIITKHGKPVAKLMPVSRSGQDLIGSLGGKLRVVGEIESTGASWDATA
ncbi:type II toxin-antitoxin system Phd/YefM family antitoxin [soil metagenome]